MARQSTERADRKPHDLVVAGDAAAAADDLPDAEPRVHLRREQRSSAHLLWGSEGAGVCEQRAET
jgi:hypothetical protein